MSLQHSHPRLAYDDPDTTAQMYVDCAAAALQMQLPARAIQASTHAPMLAEIAVEPPPSILFDDYREATKREIDISEAAARLAKLHLD